MAFSLKNLLGKPNADLIGVDISASGIKVVELSGTLKKPELVAYAAESLPKGAVTNGQIEKSDVVIETLERAIRRSGSSAKNVALAMPSSSVIVRKLKFPIDLNDEMLEIQVDAEAGTHVPFPADDIRLDFAVMDNPLLKDEQEVLLVAAKRDLVDARLNIAETLGLTPLVMDIESYTVQRTLDFMTQQLPGQGRGLMVALVSIGAYSLGIAVVNNGEIVFEREQPFGGQTLTQDIMRAYTLSAEDAELKKRNGGLPADYAQRLLTPFIEDAASVVARSLQFFFTSTPFSRVDQIMLGGGCAVLPGMVDKVLERTQMPTMLCTPTAGMLIGSGIREKQLQLDEPMLTVAFGLALRRFYGAAA